MNRDGIIAWRNREREASVRTVIRVRCVEAYAARRETLRQSMPGDPETGSPHAAAGFHRRKAASADAMKIFPWAD